MNATARLVKRLRSASDVMAELDKLEEEIRSARSRKSAKSKPSREAKEARKDDRKDRLASLVKAVWSRAGDKCEICGATGDLYALEVHHIISGGLRRYMESPETCILLCADDHRHYHRGEVGTLRTVKEWAIRHGYREALAEVEKRLAKIEEARRVPAPF